MTTVEKLFIPIIFRDISQETFFTTKKANSFRPNNSLKLGPQAKSILKTDGERFALYRSFWWVSPRTLSCLPEYSLTKRRRRDLNSRGCYPYSLSKRAH